jgi:hypothetical protein
MNVACVVDFSPVLRPHDLASALARLGERVVDDGYNVQPVEMRPCRLCGVPVARVVLGVRDVFVFTTATGKHHEDTCAGVDRDEGALLMLGDFVAALARDPWSRCFVVRDVKASVDGVLPSRKHGRKAKAKERTW